MLTRQFVCDIISTVSCDGEVSEWFKELVLKTSDPARDQEFESLPLRHLPVLLQAVDSVFHISPWRSTQVVKGLPC